MHLAISYRALTNVSQLVHLAIIQIWEAIPAKGVISLAQIVLALLAANVLPVSRDSSTMLWQHLAQRLVVLVSMQIH